MQNWGGHPVGVKDGSPKTFIPVFERKRGMS